MNIKQKVKKIYANSKMEKLLEKIVMKNIDDEKKAKIVENYIEDRPNKAVRFAKEISDPELKINTLENIAPNLKNKHVVEILNTLPNKEMSRVIDTNEIVDTLINGYYKTEIIEALRNSKTEKEKLQGIITFIESLNDSDISVLLKNTNNEEMKKRIITRKIIENYKKYGNILHVEELVKSLNKKEDIIAVIEESVDLIDRELKENKEYLDGKVKNVIRSKFFNYAVDKLDEEHNKKLEEMKVNKIDEYYKKGDLNYGGLYELISRGLRNKHEKAIVIERYRNKTAKIKDKETKKMIEVPLLTQEQLEILYDSLEERDKFVLKYSDGVMSIDEENIRKVKVQKHLQQRER